MSLTSLDLLDALDDMYKEKREKNGDPVDDGVEIALLVLTDYFNDETRGLSGTIILGGKGVNPTVVDFIEYQILRLSEKDCKLSSLRAGLQSMLKDKPLEEEDRKFILDLINN